MKIEMYAPFYVKRSWQWLRWTVFTADTITDEQIRALQKVIFKEHCDPNHPNFDRSRGLFGCREITYCWDAMNGHLHPDTRRAARARCAEILNTRTGGDP